MLPSAELLSFAPESGSVDEVHFDAFGSCSWVRFDTLEGPWCGAFGKGDVTQHDSACVNDRGSAFVIAGGQGYLIDLPSRGIVLKTEQDRLTGAIDVPGTDFFLAANFGELFALSRSGVEWRRVVALDGIRLRASTPTAVEGQVYVPDRWHQFRLSVPDWRFDCDAELPPR